ELIFAHGARDGRELGIGRHGGNEVAGIEFAESALAGAAGEHGDMIDVGVVYHGGQRGFGVAGGEFMLGVLFPELRQRHRGIVLNTQSTTEPRRHGEKQSQRQEPSSRRWRRPRRKSWLTRSVGLPWGRLLWRGGPGCSSLTGRR